MIQITIDAPRVFSTLELSILAAGFEKLSQLATMYEDAGITEPMEEYVLITKEDINVDEVIDVNGKPVIYKPEFSAGDFFKAMSLALHTTVTISVNTKFGKKTVTTPLMPCSISCGAEVAWREEPEFIIRLDEADRLQFEFFDSLRDFINLDTDGVVNTTMITGGTTVWSM